MYKVPMIVINPIYSVDDVIVGTEYLDAKLYVEIDGDPVEEFMDAVHEAVDKKRSIILYRQDVRSFTDRVGGIVSGKEVFRGIKAELRDKYTVLKLKYNPRTQEFCGVKTAFIIHYK